MNVRRRFRYLLDTPSAIGTTSGRQVTFGEVLDDIGAAEKFLMPFDGFLFEDQDMEHFLKFFKLPFNQIVLEYDGTTGKMGVPNVPSDERVRIILFAKELETTKDDQSGVMVAVSYSSQLMPGE